MIEKFEIVNYRSCIHTAFEPQPDLSVLIGPNGSGKTNILNAFLLLRSLTNEQDRWHDTSDETENECELKASFRYQSKKSILTARILLVTDENNSDVILASKESWYAKEFTGNAQRINTPLWLAQGGGPERYLYRRKMRHYSQHGMIYPSSPYGGQFYSDLKMPDTFRDSFTRSAKFLHGMKYYSASQFTNPSRCPVSFEVEQEGRRTRGLGLKGHSKFLFDLYEAKKTQSPGYAQFFSVVGPGGIGLVDSIDFRELRTSSIEHTVRSGGKVRQRSREKLLVVPQFKIGRNVLSPSQLSEGTFKTITLLFYLMTEQSSALLIEEPEVCVHHGLLSSIVELIKTYSHQKQIILSTHSDFVLDQVEPRNVYAVSRTPEAGTTVKHIAKGMSAKELRALKVYLESEGNLGEYWRHGGFE